MKRLIFLLLLTTLLIVSAGFSASTSNDKLIVYTNSGDNGRGQWLTEEAKKAGFDIKVVQIGGTTLVNRLLAEKTNPVADVTFGMSQMDWKKIEDAQGLIPYKPDWTNEIDPNTPGMSKSYSYNPLVEQRTVMLYNSNAFNDKDAPKSYKDLYTQSKYKGQYAVPSAVSGSTDRKMIISILAPYIDEDDPNAELGVKPEGWKALHQYFDNGYKTPASEDSFSNLAENKVPISYEFSSGVEGKEQEMDFKAALMKPEEGLNSGIESVGIMNKGKDHDYSKAKAFVNWFGSADVQKKWAEKFGTYPMNVKAREGSNPRINEFINQTERQHIDEDVVNKYSEQWMEKVELEYL